ncbi:MAG: AMP-dependent synthetase/ligase [Chthoniobacterales bacterium]
MPERLVAATIAELFLQAGERWGSRPAFSTRGHDGFFEAVSYASWCERACALATALIDLGVTAREHVGLLSDNCFEWILVDAAIQCCGAANVPRGSDITPAEIRYILHHADVRVVFVENRKVLQKLDSIREQLPLLKKIIVMEAVFEELAERTEGILARLFHTNRDEEAAKPDGARREMESNDGCVSKHCLRNTSSSTQHSSGFPASAVDEYEIGVLGLHSVERHGAALRRAGDRRMEERVKAIAPEDLCTLIYTSGTTGTPKGVQLTHRSLCSQIENITFSLSQEERALSLLPVWHSYELIFELLVISHGAALYYTSTRHLVADLKTVKPTVMASAPRLWEALYERMMAHVSKQSRVTQLLFQMAVRSAGWVRQAVQFFKGEQLNLTGRSWKETLFLAAFHFLRWSLGLLPFLLLDPLILRQLRKVLGGSFRATISGGGALPPYIDAFFNNIGIPIFEGYGLTESAPVLAVRTEKNFVLGTVGPPLPKTEINILDLVTGEILYPDATRADLGRGLSGEICARGPQMMKGYYKDPEGTARVLSRNLHPQSTETLNTGSAGWLRTGDIGMMTFNNCLKIIGRCKETIVLRSGENVEPLPIESRLLESPLIEQCIVVGQDQKHLGALLLPSLSAFVERGFQATSLEELLQEKKARPLLRQEVHRLISEANGFKPFERIACFELLPKPFEVGEELTSTYKLKRHVIVEQYKELIQGMYK